MFRSHNIERLRTEFQTAKPFQHIHFDNALDPAFCEAVISDYPDFETALQTGKSFSGVNEKRKVQVSDAAKFKGAVARLHETLASDEFMADLSYVTGMPNLLADPELVGGGIHMTGPGGHLDVHVDFNYIEERALHRRLNLIIYLNPGWKEEWGGHIQLWDEGVKNCIKQFAPIMNRCVLFETNEISYHGVVPINPECPSPRASFATYYYTKEAPSHWVGNAHSTIFKARPDERLKGRIAMPAELLTRKAKRTFAGAKRKIKTLLGA